MVTPTFHRLPGPDEAAEPTEDEPVYEQRERDPDPGPYHPPSLAPRSAPADAQCLSRSGRRNAFRCFVTECAVRGVAALRARRHPRTRARSSRRQALRLQRVQAVQRAARPRRRGRARRRPGHPLRDRNDRRPDPRPDPANAATQGLHRAERQRASRSCRARRRRRVQDPPDAPAGQIAHCFGWRDPRRNRDYAHPAWVRAGASRRGAAAARRGARGDAGQHRR
jgi:hypothetical protein